MLRSYAPAGSAAKEYSPVDDVTAFRTAPVAVFFT
jgi:hypothetical protein